MSWLGPQYLPQGQKATKSSGNCIKCVYRGALAASTPVLTPLLPCTLSH